MNSTLKWITLVIAAMLVGSGLVVSGAMASTQFWGGTRAFEKDVIPNYGLSDSYGPGRMGNFGRSGLFAAGTDNAQPDELTITLDEAWQLTEEYIAGDPNLEIVEVMVFSNNYYAQVREKDTGRYALELLIDPYTGAVYSEMGPNMMWNTGFGMMGGVGWGRGMMGHWGFQLEVEAFEMSLSSNEAITAAQAYIDRTLPGAIAVEPAAFDGYYTLRILQDNEITGMLSVHGTTGQVWDHTWHDNFIGMIEENE